MPTCVAVKCLEMILRLRDEDLFGAGSAIETDAGMSMVMRRSCLTVLQRRLFPATQESDIRIYESNLDNPARSAEEAQSTAGTAR